MRFIKDILLFDIQTSGPDVDRDVILQFAGSLLDKDNLLEKARYTTYLRNSLLTDTLSEHARLAHVEFEVIQNATKPLDFQKELLANFGEAITLAFPNISSFLFLRNAFRKQSNIFPYEPLGIDLWTLYYTQGMHMGLRKIPTLHTLLDYFHLPITNPYDAAERVKLEADILRRILNEY